MTAAAPLIFIVEDDPDIRQALTEVLGDAGYRVGAAQNGREALETLGALDGSAAARPALILLDLMMPQMNGVAFRTEQVKRPELAAIPVVLMTAAGARDLPKLEGIASWVTKPVRIDDLLRIVETHAGPVA